MGKLFLAFLIAVVCAAVFFVAVPAGPRSEKFIVIPPRTDTIHIAAILQQQGIIHSRAAFLVWRLYKRGTLKAGEYRFDHPAPLYEVYDRLAKGDVYTLTVTVPEGYNIFDDGQAFQAAHLKSSAEFVAAAQTNADLIKDLDPNASSLEGYLFPDTYRFSPAMTVREMQAEMVSRFRRQAIKLGLTEDVRETVTLASLVEKETGEPQERGLVASVFINRLKRSIPLATDPAVIYGLLLQGRFRGTLYAGDLTGDGPYNTYSHIGLPPGPICSPGEASLAAAMHPPATGYLYFVSDNSGHSRFSVTLAEHNANVADYRRATHATVQR